MSLDDLRDFAYHIIIIMLHNIHTVKITFAAIIKMAVQILMNGTGLHNNITIYKQQDFSGVQLKFSAGQGTDHKLVW